MGQMGKSHLETEVEMVLWAKFGCFHSLLYSNAEVLTSDPQNVTVFGESPFKEVILN